jgi:hypothetical protein
LKKLLYLMKRMCCLAFCVSLTLFKIFCKRTKLLCNEYQVINRQITVGSISEPTMFRSVRTTVHIKTNSYLFKLHINHHDMN